MVLLKVKKFQIRVNSVKSYVLFKKKAIVRKVNIDVADDIKN